MRAALSWAFGAEGDPGLGIRLTVAAITLWSETSILSEAQARLESALALAKTIDCDDLLKAKLACALGWSLFYARKLSNDTAVAWLDDGYEGDASPALGGELQLLDPRMPQIRMNAPHLRLREADGGEQLVEPFIRPRAGLLVVFPAWLAHAVRPFGGTGTRISVALNLSAD